MRDLKCEIEYDKEYNVLYLTFSDKSCSYGDEIADGYVILRDSESNEITGVTILDYILINRFIKEENT